MFIEKLHGETSDIVKSLFTHVFKPYLVSVLCSHCTKAGQKNVSSLKLFGIFVFSSLALKFQVQVTLIIDWNTVLVEILRRIQILLLLGRVFNSLKLNIANDFFPM